MTANTRASIASRGQKRDMVYDDLLRQTAAQIFTKIHPNTQRTGRKIRVVLDSRPLLKHDVIHKTRSRPT